MEDPQMRYNLLGFVEELGFRVFSFEGVGAEWARTRFTVRADLALSRRYGIRLQELPLLCRRVLEGRDGDAEARAFTFGEDAMAAYSTLAAQKQKASERKPPRRPVPPPGGGWASGASPQLFARGGSVGPGGGGNFASEQSGVPRPAPFPCTPGPQPE